MHSILNLEELEGKERKHSFQGIILEYVTVWKQIKAEGSAKLEKKNIIGRIE